MTHIVAEQGTINEYRRLKELKRRSQEDGPLTEEMELAWGLGRLLSYSDEAIKGLWKSPFSKPSPYY